MQKNNILRKSVLLTSWLVSAALAVCTAMQGMKIHELQAEIKPYEGYQFATIQYSDNYTGELITVQGTLNFDAILQPVGNWMYEYNGIEAVMSGARVIGDRRVPYSVTGNVVVYLADGTSMTFYGTIVKPLENDENLVFYMVDSELTDRENILDDFFERRSKDEE